MYICISADTYIRMQIYMYLQIYVHVYMFMYLQIYVYIYPQITYLFAQCWGSCCSRLCDEKMGIFLAIKIA